ncbi:MAG: hypothetical protein ACFFCW_09560 [Candidatus Hodarchaeota archaeon]
MLNGEDKLGIYIINKGCDQRLIAGIPEWALQDALTLTIAKIANIIPVNSIDLPESFTRFLQVESTGFVLMILTLRSRMIRLIPTQSKEVVKVIIEISELSTGFFKIIEAISFKYEISMLYSTGVCFSDKGCIYEGYFDKAGFTSASLKNLRTELNSIPGVSSIDFTILKAE